MKTRLILVALSFVAMLFAPPAARAAGNLMQPGEWEITASTEIAGMAHHMPPATFTHCVKPEDVKDAQSMLRKSQEHKEDCEMKDVTVEGNKVTWTVECHRKTNFKGTGTMVYGGSSYEGTMEMETTDPKRGPMKITTHLKGRRIGDCK